jgi:hypothetical protein
LVPVAENPQSPDSVAFFEAVERNPLVGESFGSDEAGGTGTDDASTAQNWERYRGHERSASLTRSRAPSNEEICLASQVRERAAFSRRFPNVESFNDCAPRNGHLLMENRELCRPGASLPAWSAKPEI